MNRLNYELFLSRPVIILFLSILMLISSGVVWSQVAPDPDLNNDGVVNILDITTVGVCFGQDPSVTTECSIADTNGDGAVDFADISFVVASFGQSGFPIAGAVEDTTAPTVTINLPIANKLFNGSPVTVTGTIDDDSAELVVNGIPAINNGGSFTAQAVPLREGRNILTATATDATGNVGTDNVQVLLDTGVPSVTIDFPSENAVLTTVQVDVGGQVNDIITGTTINAADCQVTVNGVDALVSNRSWMVRNLLLQRGRNTLNVIATDRAGNTRQVSRSVMVDDVAGQRIVLLSGNNQIVEAGSPLPEALVVTLLDRDGSPVTNRPVNFRVSRGNGVLGAFPNQGSELTVNTDQNGLASILFTLGKRVGVGNHRVSASALGFVGDVEFCAISTTGAAQLITSLSGDRQTGEAETELPLPFVVLVTDDGGNPVEGVEVQFNVEQGGGSFQGVPSLTVITDSDGLVSTLFTLGAQEGLNNNVVMASVVGLSDTRAIFNASGRVAGLKADTSVSGVVLDNQDNPVPGVTVFLEQDGVTLDPVPTAITDAEGMFQILNAPVGTLHLIADGSTTSRSGRWVRLSSEITTIAGIDNSLGQPFWLLPLADNEVLVQTGGPDQDLMIQVPGVPGAELIIPAHSVRCVVNGVPEPECSISATQVRSERVPMPPPLGSSFMLAATLQPSGTLFDPPVSVCIPNSGEQTPGEQVEMFSFDHSLGEFVATGTATVTADGAQICSDPGFGIVKAGWYGCVPPPPPKKCTISCNDQNECTNTTKNDPPCNCSTQKLTGPSCGDRPGINSCKKPGTCVGGACQAENKPDNSTCDDGLACTENDKCTGGACKGTKKPDKILTNTEITLEPLNRALQKAQAFFNLMQIKGVTIPKFQGKLTFERKNVCCEVKNGSMTLEETGGGQLILPLFAPDPFRPTIPPWSGDYTITIFGRSIGVAYGIEVLGNVSASAGLSRTKRECQDDTCWAGTVTVGAGIGAGLFGEIPNPALPAECGANMNMTCTVLRMRGNASSGLNLQGTVGCDKFTGQAGHDGLKFNAEFTALEGTFFNFSVTRSLVIIQPGKLGDPLIIQLPI